MKNKTLNMNFPKVFKRFIIIALAVILIGGAGTSFVFSTQISEICDYKQQRDAEEEAAKAAAIAAREKNATAESTGDTGLTDTGTTAAAGTDNNTSSQTVTGGASLDKKDDGYKDDKKNKDDRKDRDEKYDDDFEKAHVDLKSIITVPTTSQKVVLGVYIFLCLAIVILYWLIIAAWMYKISKTDGFSGALWFALTLVFNLVAVIVYHLIRRFAFVKCGKCGKYALRDKLFCDECGNALKLTCPQCGKTSRTGTKYCAKCGACLSGETTEEQS